MTQQCALDIGAFFVYSNHMQQLTDIIAGMLAQFGIPGEHVFFGNTLGDYALALTVLILSIAIFALAQFFTLSWLAAISERTKTDLDDAFVKMVRSFRPPFYLFLALWFSLRFLTITGIADSIVTAVLVIWIVYQAVIIVGILVEDVIFRHLTKDQDETAKSALHLLANLAKGVMWVLGILLVLSNFGVNVTSLMAGAGIAGIAIAFALQGILSDLFSSFSLYFDKPFKVGDFIIVGDTMGVVKHIGIKSTRIKALSGEEITMSNQELTGARIRNFKLMEERRVVFGFGVLYETPAAKLKQVSSMVQEIVERRADTRFDRAHFKSFGESSLDFEVVYHVLTSDYTRYMDIQQEINQQLFERFEREGIGFAYPTRTLYLHQ